VRIAVLNGPNLNLLGSREPEIYGRATLGDIERAVRERARALDAQVEWEQTNDEGRFVELVQGLVGRADGLLVNAAAFTHSSLAIRDALLAVRIPFVEVHLSNIFAREPERRRSVLSDAAVGIVAGFGATSYVVALEALVRHLNARAG
jgi:3-dehydroquinate dehydratase-2